MLKINGVIHIPNNFIMDTSSKSEHNLPKDTEDKECSFNTIFQEELQKLNDSLGGVTMSNIEQFDYTQCEHFLQEDVTPWHGDVFDHPSYETYCTKGGQKKPLVLPENQCKRCYERSQNESQGC